MEKGVIKIVEIKQKVVGEIISNKLNHKDKVIEVAHKLIGDLDRECLAVFMVSSSLQINSFNIIHIGSLTSSPVHPREVFKPAILANAAGIILVHNHPSGDLAPSKADIEITESIGKAGQLLEINLLDHVIIGGGTGASIRDTHPELF